MPAVASLTSSRVGPWILRELIGQGGAAEVHRADHVDGGSPVAVKVLRAERAADRGNLKRFEDEFAALSRRLHPGIPVAKRQGEVAGRPCIVMDLIDGKPLPDLLAQGQRISGLRSLQELCVIVEAIHQAGLIHNDLKLENCLLKADGSLALVDFGSVRPVTPRKSTSSIFAKPEKMVFGTATYLAPELVAGKRPTVRSDVYALGVCAFRLLTGRYPFEASTQSGRLRANANSAPPKLATRIKGIPPGPAGVIDACLAKDPDQRTATVLAVHVAVRQLQEKVRA